MTARLEEDSHLTIQLLGFDRPEESAERYYFLEMSTLQATILLPPDRKIVVSEIVAYTNDGKFITDQPDIVFITISDFNNFFINNPDYYIHNCNIELEDGLKVRSHDDGEVSVQFDRKDDQLFISKFFKKYNLDEGLINILKSKPGHYLLIDIESNIIGDFESFDDYLENGRFLL
jgi:hypothetical protein